MRKADFNELVQSVREAGAIRRANMKKSKGKKKPKPKPKGY